MGDAALAGEVAAASEGAGLASAAARTVGGVGLLADGEGLAISGATLHLSAELAELARNSNVTVDRNGFIRVRDGVLGVSPEDVVTYTPRDGSPPQAVGVLHKGELWALDAAGKPYRPIATVRGIPKTSVNLRANPTVEAPSLSKLPPGREVQILELRRGWFRVSFSRNNQGWVPASVLALSLIVLPSALQPFIDSSSAAGTPQRAVLDFFDSARRGRVAWTVANPRALGCGEDIRDCVLAPYKFEGLADFQTRYARRSHCTHCTESPDKATIHLITFWGRNEEPFNRGFGLEWCARYELDSADGGWRITSMTGVWPLRC